MQDVLHMAYQHPALSRSDMDIIIASHTQEKFSKGDFLLKKDQIPAEYYILESGLIRSFLYDYEGNDITTGFMGNGQVVIEVASTFQRIPTHEYMQCETDCIVWTIQFDIFQDLFHQIPAFREWGRAWMAFELYKSKMRATEMITLPAAKRYLQLIQDMPQVLQQAPLKHVATFLGVTNTSLSRIRKEVSKL